MFKKSIKSIVILLLITGIIYCAHKLFFSVFKINQNSFIYSLEQLYVFFGVFSAVIELILIRVKEKNIDIVGNVFLLLTLIKINSITAENTPKNRYNCSNEYIKLS